MFVNPWTHKEATDRGCGDSCWASGRQETCPMCQEAVVRVERSCRLQTRPRTSRRDQPSRQRTTWTPVTNTNTNRIYIACPGALTNVKTRNGIDEFLKGLKSIGVSGKLNAVREGIPGSWTSVTGATFTEFSSSATFDVVSSVGGAQIGSTTGFSYWLHRPSILVHDQCEFDASNLSMITKKAS